LPQACCFQGSRRRNRCGWIHYEGPTASYQCASYSPVYTSESAEPVRHAVLSSGSAAGLSLPSYVLETLSYAITLAYAVRQNFPFSTYGENAFLTVQNALITLLIAALPSTSTLRPSTPPAAAPKLIPLIVSGAAAAYFLASAPASALGYAQLATLPLGLASKLPQIRQNARARSTGQLSAFAVIAQVFGSLARLFTTFAETKDLVLAAGFGLGFALNCVLAYQMLAYGGAGVGTPATPARKIAQPVPVRAVKEEAAILSKKEGEKVGSRPATPIGRTGSPVPRYGSPTPSRRWSRKID
jgi:mannose-P-dolichol utilization defect protein 1